MLVSITTALLLFPPPRFGDPNKGESGEVVLEVVKKLDIRDARDMAIPVCHGILEVDFLVGELSCPKGRRRGLEGTRGLGGGGRKLGTGVHLVRALGRVVGVYVTWGNCFLRASFFSLGDGAGMRCLGNCPVMQV